MDENFDTYEIANIERIQLFFPTLNYLFIFLNFILLVKYIYLTALHRLRSPSHLSALLRQPSRSYMLVYFFVSDLLYI
jgi:hypothetical protein